MRLFVKKYLDGYWGTAEEVDDSITLIADNDEKGVFNWVEVKIIDKGDRILI